MREGRMDRVQLECYCKWLTDKYRGAEETIEELKHTLKVKNEQVAIMKRVLDHAQDHSKCEELRRMKKIINGQQSTIHRITQYINDFCDVEAEKLEEALKGDENDIE